MFGEGVCGGGAGTHSEETLCGGVACLEVKDQKMWKCVSFHLDSSSIIIFQWFSTGDEHPSRGHGAMPGDISSCPNRGTTGI